MLQYYTNANWALLHVGVLLMMIYAKLINPIPNDDEFTKVDSEDAPAAAPETPSEEIALLKS